jgi:hypothetical protein
MAGDRFDREERGGRTIGEIGAIEETAGWGIADTDHVRAIDGRG